MLELKNCYFTGLPGMSELKIDLLKISTLTGPNGTGKSTVLRILELALKIIEIGDVCDQLPDHEPWHLFRTAKLQFQSAQLLSTKLLGETKSLTILIECDESGYLLSEFQGDEEAFSISMPVAASTLTEWTSLAAEAREQLNRYQQQLEAVTGPQHHHIMTQQEHGRNKATKQERESLEALKKNKMLAVQYKNDEEAPSEILRSEVTNFIKSLALPTSRFVTTQDLMQQDIPALIANLVKLKKGAKSDTKKFKEHEERLNQLMQSEIDVSETDAGQSLLINGVPYTRASTGTFLTLSFFAVTQSEDTNKIILWDEPENGLHPTRRIQLLDLMRLDGRHFIIATHAPEFAPVLQDDSKVYRCISNYDEPTSTVQLSVEPIANRRDAFAALEALGIHPARTLFTANVVIWVEGPTELAFYKYWLSARLSGRGYQEGLHYTFMPYGGSLINYLSAAEDWQIESTVDLLNHCRHPIVLVDSDFSEAPDETVPMTLKKGAQRLHDQLRTVNAGREDAALFKVTRGREVENYIPKKAIWHALEIVWPDFLTYKNELKWDQLDLGQYRKYPEAISDFFKTAGIVDADGLPKGRSKWGANNKVAMMQAALSTPGLIEQDLELRCSDEIAEIAEFIRSKHEVDFRIGLRK